MRPVLCREARDGASQALPQELLSPMRNFGFTGAWDAGARKIVESYCGHHSAADPCISPLLAEDSILSQFPPVLIHADSEEELMQDAVEMTKRCQRLGINSELTLFHGTIHVFQLCSKYKEQCADSLDRVSAFLDGVWGSSASASSRKRRIGSEGDSAPT